MFDCEVRKTFLRIYSLGSECLCWAGVDAAGAGGAGVFPGRGFLQVRFWLPGKTSREGWLQAQGHLRCLRFKKVFPGRES